MISFGETVFQLCTSRLEKNSAAKLELVVGFYKVGSGKQSITWPESVDEALCHGWIDGVRTRIDETSYKIRFTPRKGDSIWSAINIAKFQDLSAQGRMTAASGGYLAARVSCLSARHRCGTRTRTGRRHASRAPASRGPRARAM